MNLILFKRAGRQVALSHNDPRTEHIRKDLKIKTGDVFDVGIENGPRGKALLVKDTAKEGMLLEISWAATPPSPFAITLLVGLPRPQTARKILCELTSLGVEAIYFFRSEKGESSYAKSRLWSNGEWEQYLIQGAEQAFTTHLPKVKHFESLDMAIHALKKGPDRIALDNYEATLSLNQIRLKADASYLAIGSERGWSSDERDLLRNNGFNLGHLGERVLRSETACIAAVSLIIAKMGKL